MKPENFTLSYDKWNPKDGVLSELNKPGRIDWEKVAELLGNPCGHCHEYWYFHCFSCNLNPSSLCGKGYGDYDLINDMIDRALPRNKRKARAIANRIFNQILLDKPEGM